MGKHSAGPKHGAPAQKRSHAGLIAALIVVVVLAGAVAAGLTVGRPYVAPYVDPLLTELGLPPLVEPEPEEDEDPFVPADFSGFERPAATLAKRIPTEGANGYAEVIRCAPTPIFAYCGDIALHVAVPSSDLTELLFHQASYGWALNMTTPLEETPAEDADESTGTPHVEEQAIGDQMFKGTVLRLYRWGRRGTPDTAVDCGAAAGTPALSPVNGTVVLVEPYLLYNKYPDYQVHIQPDGHPELDVVLIHLENPCVTAGTRVVAGKTQIAQIRDLSSLMTLQLAEYTAGDDPGNHTHICVNDANDSGYFGLVGAAVLDSSGNVVTPATITADTPIEDVVKMREDAASAAGTTDISLPNTASTASTAGA